MRSAKVGRTSSPSSGPAGAGESTASRGVPVEDRWVGGGEPATTPEVLMEGSNYVVVPHEMMEAGGVAALPKALTERGGSIAAPSEIREASPPAREQGAGSKWSRPYKLEQETRGSSPKRSYRPTTLE